MEENRKIGILDGFWLKVIMLILMTLDHLYYGLFPDTLGWAHIAARVVAPVFAYLIAEGLVYTRSRKKYILRITLFGVIMFAGNVLLYGIYGRWIDNSILLALAIGAGMVAAIECSKRAQSLPRHLLWIFLALALFSASMASDWVYTWLYEQGRSIGVWVQMIRVEGGNMIPLMILIFYYLRRHPVIMWLVFAVVLCTPYLAMYLSTGYLQEQIWMIFSFVPIALYNGRRGIRNQFTKYLFYLYYPLHIWIIYLIEQSL